MAPNAVSGFITSVRSQTTAPSIPCKTVCIILTGRTELASREVLVKKKKEGRKKERKKERKKNYGTRLSKFLLRDVIHRIRGGNTSMKAF